MNLKLSLLFSVTLMLALLHASNSQVTDRMGDEQTDITDEVGNQRSVSSTTQKPSADEMDTTNMMVDKSMASSTTADNKEQESIRITNEEHMSIMQQKETMMELILDVVYGIAQTMLYREMSPEDIEELCQTTSREIFDKHSQLLLYNYNKSKEFAIQNLAETLKNSAHHKLKEFRSPETAAKFEKDLENAAVEAVRKGMDAPNFFANGDVLPEIVSRLYRDNRSYWEARTIPKSRAVKLCKERLVMKIRQQIGSIGSWIEDRFSQFLEETSSHVAEQLRDASISDEELLAICLDLVSRYYHKFKFIFEITGRSKDARIEEDSMKMKSRVLEILDERKRNLALQKKEMDVADRLQTQNTPVKKRSFWKNNPVVKFLAKMARSKS